MSWLLITFGRGREATKDLGEVKRQGQEGETENLVRKKKGVRRERKRGEKG